MSLCSSWPVMLLFIVYWGNKQPLVRLKRFHWGMCPDFVCHSEQQPPLETLPWLIPLVWGDILSRNHAEREKRWLPAQRGEKKTAAGWKPSTCVSTWGCLWFYFFIHGALYWTTRSCLWTNTANIIDSDLIIRIQIWFKYGKVIMDDVGLEAQIRAAPPVAIVYLKTGQFWMFGPSLKWCQNTRLKTRKISNLITFILNVLKNISIISIIIKR